MIGIGVALGEGMSKWLVPISIIGALLTTSCSYQTRTLESGITPAEMEANLAELEQAQSLSTSAGPMADVLAMKNKESMSVYYADAWKVRKDVEGLENPSAFGSVASVLSFNDFAFLGDTIGDLGYETITYARVFVFVAGEEVGLIVGYKLNDDAFTYRAFKGTGSIADGSFDAVLENGNGQTIGVQSFDLEDGDLANVIQLKVYMFDPNGEQRYIGKFSTLEGFRY